MGLRTARGVRDIDHALFIDDSILLGGASSSSASRFELELDRYCLDSGSVLNTRKCFIYAWNLSGLELSMITRIFGFKFSMKWVSFKYLGLPIFQGFPIGRDWCPLLEKFKLKIQAWGTSWLNLAGKTVLIKSFLNNLPIFQIYVLLAPVCILRKMEQSIRSFFWKGGKNNAKRILLVSCDKIAMPLLEGGLHLKDLKEHNITLGAKILWRQVARNLGWSQISLWKKYSFGKHIRSLENF